MLSRLPQSFFRLVFHRQTSLRTNLEDAGNFVEQSLVLHRITSLERFDVVGRGIDLLCQLSLCHLVRFLTPSVPDRCAQLGGDFGGGDDIVGAVDFGEMGAIATGFVDLGR